MSSRPHSPPTSTTDLVSISLNRLLTRLEQQLLSSDPNPLLRTSAFERKKTAANIDHARTLILSLEHTLTTPSAHLSSAQKSKLQTDIKDKRELLKRLNQRVYELENLDDGSASGSASEGESDDSDDDEEEEEWIREYAPRLKSNAGIEARSGAEGGEGNEALRQAATNLGTSLRNRKTAESASRDDNTATSTSLFDNKPSSTTVKDTETLLSHNRHEQESLTSSLLTMARDLKLSSLQFQDSLKSDQGVLDRAVEGLDRSGAGLEAASQRMGVLRRMTEGRGWWGRVKLYAVIFGLWVAAFLLVFVGPKVRF